MDHCTAVAVLTLAFAVWKYFFPTPAAARSALLSGTAKCIRSRSARAGLAVGAVTMLALAVVMTSAPSSPMEPSGAPRFDRGSAPYRIAGETQANGVLPVMTR